jgi:hypothetical protein
MSLSSCTDPGRTTVNVAPPAFWLSAIIWPPWACTISLVMKRPSPVPCLLLPPMSFVTNFSKSLGRISGGIPVPASLILISSFSDSSFVQLTLILPVWVNLMALPRMFENACSSLSLSAFTNASAADRSETIETSAGFEGLKLCITPSRRSFI